MDRVQGTFRAFRDISRNYTPVTFAHPAMQPGKPSRERKLCVVVVVVARSASESGKP